VNIIAIKFFRHYASWISRNPTVITRATKSQQSQNFSSFFKACETSTNQISRSYHEGIVSYYVKKSKIIIRSKFIVGSNFSCSTVFSLYPYFIETTTTDIDRLLHVLLQLCNNNGFAVISHVIILFCPLLDD